MGEDIWDPRLRVRDGHLFDNHARIATRLPIVNCRHPWPNGFRRDDWHRCCRLDLPDFDRDFRDQSRVSVLHHFGDISVRCGSCPVANYSTRASLAGLDPASSEALGQSLSALVSPYFIAPLGDARCCEICA